MVSDIQSNTLSFSHVCESISASAFEVQTLYSSIVSPPPPPAAAAPPFFLFFFLFFFLAVLSFCKSQSTRTHEDDELRTHASILGRRLQLPRRACSVCSDASTPTSCSRKRAARRRAAYEPAARSLPPHARVTGLFAAQK